MDDGLASTDNDVLVGRMQRHYRPRREIRFLVLSALSARHALTEGKLS
jgi:hypothetical protein